MIRLIQAHEKHLFPELIDQMFQLRARQFNDRLGWKVKVSGGHERDGFDDLNPLYVVSVDTTEKVVGTFRLLQTTGPTMLSDVFSELVPDGLIVRSPIIWESTRFCVDTELAKEKAESGLNLVTGELLSALLEIGVAAGLSHIVTVIDVRMERILRRSKCPIDRLAPPQRIDGVPSLAILMECTDETVARVHETNGIPSPCIISEDAARLGLAV